LGPGEAAPAESGSLDSGASQRRDAPAPTQPVDLTVPDRPVTVLTPGPSPARQPADEIHPGDSAGEGRTAPGPVERPPSPPARPAVPSAPTSPGGEGPGVRTESPPEDPWQQ